MNYCRVAKSSCIAASDMDLTKKFPVTRHDQNVVVIYISWLSVCFLEAGYENVQVDQAVFC